MKFSIITPVFNSKDFITETIESVISQAGNFDIEYIIQDGASTDGTLDIIRKYADVVNSGAYKISCSSVAFIYTSEKDEGIFDAINKGCEKATGDFYGLMCGDDIYKPGAFQAMATALQKFPEIAWLKGITSFIDVEGKPIQHSQCYIYNKSWIEKGIYGRYAYFIQSDSVFLHASLWKKIGRVPIQYKNAADYWLWMNIGRYATLWSLNADISAFRKRKGQVSSNVAAYKKDQRAILPHRSLISYPTQIFFSAYFRLYPHFEHFFLAIYPLIFWNRNQEYIDTENGVPVKKRARSFIA